MKAQMNQAFTYIAIMLLLGVIVYFGAQAVKTLFDANCEQEKATFVGKVNDFIEQYSDKGSVRHESVVAPCGVKKLCFVDSSVLGTAFSPLLSDGVMFESVKDGTYNIFYKDGFTNPLGLSGKVAANPEGEKYLCIDARSGSFRMTFTGQGRKTLVEERS